MSLRTRPMVPRRKDFQRAFVSGNSRGLTSRPSQERVLGAHVLSCTLAEVCGFIYVAFILCMKKHSSGIGFSYVRFLFLFFFFFVFVLSFPYVSLDMSPLFKVTG